MEVDFRRGIAEQIAVEHQFGGILLLEDACLQLNGAATNVVLASR